MQGEDKTGFFKFKMIIIFKNMNTWENNSLKLSERFLDVQLLFPSTQDPPLEPVER